MTRSATQARSKLVARRTELTRTQAANERGDQELREDSEAQMGGSSEVLIQLTDRERLEVDTIDAAIGRLDGGSWGKCVQCEDRIALKRLAAMPEATLCLDCASAQPNRG